MKSKFLLLADFGKALPRLQKSVGVDEWSKVFLLTK